MAQYVVIQDIEAEDKFVGPLTLRQFIFAGITIILLYLCFLVVTNGLWPAVIVFLPPALISGFLAFPWGRDQPTEIWLLARLRFLFKPHLRIWDQSGLQQLVTITAPKQVTVDLTNGLDATQVTSRLEALAHTLDTRGWALKGVEVNMSAGQPAAAPGSDRLVSASTLPVAQTPATTIRSSDDMLDMQNNPAAAQMAQMAQANEAAHRQALMDKMDQIRNEQAQASQVPAPGTAQAASQTPVVAPLPQALQAAPANAPTTPMPEPPKPAILELASNDDLSVATIARQANKSQSGDNEVVISLR